MRNVGLADACTASKTGYTGDKSWLWVHDVWGRKLPVSRPKVLPEHRASAEAQEEKRCRSTRVRKVKVLLSADEVQAGVARLAAQIAAAYQENPLTIVGVMTGSLLLVADLVRRLPMPLRLGVLQTSSYRGGTQRGDLYINTDGLLDIRGRHVLLVDDIFDTGHTLHQLRQVLQEYQPLSLRSAVLLLKRGRQQVEYRPEFVAFEIPDEFVVGYGLDYQDRYRNLPFVAALEAADMCEGSE